METNLEERSTVKSEQQEMIEEHPQKKNKQRGGLRTMPFILANEMCDKFAGVGFHANMITYLTQQLNMPLVEASNTITNFAGTASFTPLIGALIADSFTGQFWTITFGSVFYQLGMLSITISTILPKLHPRPCPTQMNCQAATSWQLWIFYLSLFLISIGTGGIRPCVVTFAANQFNMSKSSVAARKWNYFNWYYFLMGIATLTALTVLVYIQDNVGWGWGLGIPTVAMTISVIAFVSGYQLYIKLKPAGSPLIRIVQVGVAAWKKRKVAMPIDPSLLYQNWEIDAAISTHGKLLHTQQFKWLNKAAIITQEDQAHDLKAPNLWNLCTVHRVEELKSIIRILPIWAAGILLVTASSHQGSFVMQQARTMDRHLSSSVQIPPASLAIFTMVTMLIGLVLYERVFVPYARKFTRNPAGITCLQRMGVGFVINIFGTVVASLVEKKRKTVVAKYNLFDKPTSEVPISVFWLVPQYCIHGLAEVFMNVGHLEFLYDQAPESMKSTAAALFFLSTSIGNYMGTLMVSLIHTYTGKHNWLPDRNINKGRLEYYYLLVSGIQLVNFIYYIICAYFYTYKPLEHVEESNKKCEEHHPYSRP